MDVERMRFKPNLILFILIVLSGCQGAERPFPPFFAASPTKPPKDILERMPDDLNALIGWLETAYLSGRPANQIESLLQSHALLTQNGTTLQAVDLDRDGKQEWLVTLRYHPFDGIPGSMLWRIGNFLILGRAGVLYRLDWGVPNGCRSMCLSPEIPLGLERSAPEVVGTGDLTGDQREEVVIKSAACGAHTCSVYYLVVSDHSGRYYHVALGSQIPAQAYPIVDAYATGRLIAVHMTYAKLDGIRDVTGDGVADLLINGGWHGSVGSGIQNEQVEVWSWTGESLELVEVRWRDSRYREHLLWQANYFVDIGELEMAQTLYRDVVLEEELLDVVAHFGFRVDRSSRRFAAFRLLTLAYLAQDGEEADVWLHWLLWHARERPLTQAALLLRADMEAGTDLTAACQKGTDYLLPYEAVDHILDRTNPTGHLYMDAGYANPELTVEDLCLPIVEEDEL